MASHGTGDASLCGAGRSEIVSPFTALQLRSVPESQWPARSLGRAPSKAHLDLRGSGYDVPVIQHLQHNWPLALIALALAVYLAIVLVGGTFFTNQGRIERATDPSRYWRWIRIFTTLFVLSVVVLIGSYVLGPSH